VRQEPLWECPGCGKHVRCDPTAGDDWAGIEDAAGPTCEECEYEMEPVQESPHAAR
jgi:hypothetical protein